MEGILEKFMRDAARNPDRPMYELLDCGTDPFIHYSDLTVPCPSYRLAAGHFRLQGEYHRRTQFRL